MRFTIFTHVEHTAKGEGYFAYSPYVREMNIWISFFEEVEVVAPSPQPPKGESIYGEAYQHSKLIFTHIPSFDVLSIASIFTTLFKVPLIFFRILGSMQRADHIHLRCPGNIGLLACICQIFLPCKQKTAKYAGNWDPEAKQPWSYKLQKWILSNTFLTRNMTVLVYGQWPSQTKNILTFFTASFYENEIVKIEKDLSKPLKFLFVGNLVPGKHPFFAINLMEGLETKNIKAELHVYGDGPLKDELEKQTKNKDFIYLHGNQPLEVLKQAYKESHFLILASKSEGWPKAVAEAMFFGCIPIATDVSCVPWMLGSPSPDSSRDQKGEAKNVTFTKRGILIPDGENGKDGAGMDRQYFIEKTVESLSKLIKNTEEMKRMSTEAQVWSQSYTLEKFDEAIKKVLESDNRMCKKRSSPFGRGEGVG